VLTVALIAAVWWTKQTSPQRPRGDDMPNVAAALLQTSPAAEEHIVIEDELLEINGRSLSGDDESRPAEGGE
jgi:hypothetical protein